MKRSWSYCTQLLVLDTWCVPGMIDWPHRLSGDFAYRTKLYIICDTLIKINIYYVITTTNFCGGLTDDISANSKTLRLRFAILVLVSWSSMSCTCTFTGIRLILCFRRLTDLNTVFCTCFMGGVCSHGLESWHTFLNSTDLFGIQPLRLLWIVHLEKSLCLPHSWLEIRTTHSFRWSCNSYAQYKRNFATSDFVLAHTSVRSPRKSLFSIFTNNTYAIKVSQHKSSFFWKQNQCLPSHLLWHAAHLVLMSSERWFLPVH